MRAFIALPLPEQVRGPLAALQHQLDEAGADVKWVAPDQLHVTLKFLGEIPPPDAAAVETLLRSVAAQTPSFALSAGAVGAFPSLRAPRVIWVGLTAGRERAIGLAQAIEASGTAVPGWVREERPFAAHITLGRVRSPRGRDALAAQMAKAVWEAPLPWLVERMTLYQSVLGAGGSQYTPLAEIPLRA